jgi:hypothetical protein
VYDYGPEIDIVELKYEDPTPGLDNHAYYYPCEGGYHEVPDSWKDNPFNWSTLNSHTFKCIWTPTKTEWYVDNTKLHTIYDTGNNHYPNKSMVIILCQQLWPYDEDLDNIDVPVASTFHWVRAKEFFLAPEITITDPICTTGTAVLDVAPNAKNIQWSLSPSYLFSGSTTGTGKNATIYAAAGVRGEGKIIYQFDMEGINGDEHFTAERNVWVGKPQIYAYGNHIVDVNTGMPVYDLCYGTHNDVEAVHPAGDASITDWDWQVSYGQVYPYGSIDQYATIYPNDYQSFMLEIRACNACGYSDWAHMYTNVVDCGRFLLVFTPNPTTGETTLSIESESQEKTFDKNTEWEMEIYNQSQLLKEKKTSLRGQSTKIQTQGWKEGVYIVRVKYKDEILQGKLIVKK